MADTVTFQDFSVAGGATETYAIIAHDDGSFTSMTKADYEASTHPSESSIPTTPQAGA